MRKLLLTLLTTGCLGILSQANANYPCGDVCGGPGPCGPCYNNCYENSFEGWYIGANLGWAFHDRHWTDRDNWSGGTGFNFATSRNSIHFLNDGVTVGFQTGYNWQCGCAVYGLEVDANWVNAERKHDFGPATGLAPGDIYQFRHRVEHSWFGTIRGRSGIVCNNWLLYFTAGAAWAHVKHNWNQTSLVSFFGPPASSDSFSDHRTRWGLALGFGAEWLLCGNWTLKAEALYMRFPEHTRSFTSTAPNPDRRVRFDLSDEVWVGRVGFNYKFCGCGGFGWW